MRPPALWNIRTSIRVNVTFYRTFCRVGSKNNRENLLLTFIYHLFRKAQNFRIRRCYRFFCLLIGPFTYFVVFPLTGTVFPDSYAQRHPIVADIIVFSYRDGDRCWRMGHRIEFFLEQFAGLLVGGSARSGGYLRSNGYCSRQLIDISIRNII